MMFERYFCGWFVMIWEWVVTVVPWVLIGCGAAILYLILAKIWDTWRGWLETIAESLDFDKDWDEYDD